MRQVVENDPLQSSENKVYVNRPLKDGCLAVS